VADEAKGVKIIDCGKKYSSSMACTVVAQNDAKIAYHLALSQDKNFIYIAGNTSGLHIMRD